MEIDLVDEINKLIEDSTGILVELSDGESVSGQVQSAEYRDGFIVLTLV